MTDHLSRTGAAFLAARLNDWWHRSGARHVRHWVEPGGTDRTSQGDDDGRTIWAVRSNLVRGNPPPRDAAGSDV